MSTSKPLNHVEIYYPTAGGGGVTAFIAASDETIAAAENWVAERRPEVPAYALYNWLLKNGGKLDREDGPAIVATQEGFFGAREVTEIWYKDGKRHRDNGPAYVNRHANGQLEESWYQNGQKIPAPPRKPLAAISGVLLHKPAA